MRSSSRLQPRTCVHRACFYHGRAPCIDHLYYSSSSSTAPIPLISLLKSPLTSRRAPSTHVPGSHNDGIAGTISTDEAGKLATPRSSETCSYLLYRYLPRRLRYRLELGVVHHHHHHLSQCPCLPNREADLKSWEKSTREGQSRHPRFPLRRSQTRQQSLLLQLPAFRTCQLLPSCEVNPGTWEMAARAQCLCNQSHLLRRNRIQQLRRLPQIRPLQTSQILLKRKGAPRLWVRVRRSGCYRSQRRPLHCNQIRQQLQPLQLRLTRTHQSLRNRRARPRTWGQAMWAGYRGQSHPLRNRIQQPFQRRQ